MNETYSFAKATEDQLQRLLGILDCLNNWQLENVLTWADGGEFYLGTGSAIQALELLAAERREAGDC